ncbi:purine-cytosine permease family protein [Litchfieldella xinjiangensis]|uniref:purine-cytosine permease family protein n=1 Tax=Litchfieldella xinjiangensis TaxID=1166948 RepID=UPI0005BE18CC|nr:membrane protein [Halomonas xinjiangensis]
MTDTIKTQSAGGESAPVGGEYERQPVPDRARMGFKSFIGMYAGEHTAGTELMIGPLFVLAGVGAFDVIVGLIIGNLLAVLSWLLLTAPIATRVRLTLYYHLEKIAGRYTVILYNLANGLAFCFLAGAMITVSATAVGVWFGFPLPTLADMTPSSLGWVLSVLAVGIVITLVAAYGYRFVSWFANIAAPWMVLIFLGFGIVSLKWFIDASGSSVTSAGDLWALADTAIWTGVQVPGQPTFSIWHVIFFAWFANMAMHVGMADLSVLRFAHKSWYSIASAAGMYVGHFMAWLAASMLFAFQMYEAGLTSDSAMIAAAEAGNIPNPLPGPLADQALGVAGLICVIIAGWTTANPTIYRAGLAFQAIIPSASRFKVTIATGLLTTLVAMFPGVAMQLLGFVALYGLLLMPIGAVIFIDFWVLPKLGLKSFHAEYAGHRMTYPVLGAWLITLAICLVLVEFAGIEIFFVALPGWFIAAILFISLSFVAQRNPSSRVARQTSGQDKGATVPASGTNKGLSL